MSDLILVLDDEQSYATMVSDLLGEHGYQTDVCTQPREALERLHQKSYGLIITDYKMPDIDGAELLLEIRKVLPHIPVIMVSGLMGKPDLLKVANMGVTLVLEKPFNVPAFLDYVARYVQPSNGATSDTMAAIGAAKPGGDAARVYPRPLVHLVDESAVMQSFLDGLWDRVQHCAHTLLLLPPGGEIEPIVRQCCVWLGHNDRDVCRISTPEMSRPEIRAALLERAKDEAASPLIAVGVPNLVELDLPVLEDFIRWTQQEPAVRDRLKFIHALPDVIEARQFAPSEDIAEGVSANLLLPLLRDRLVDLGGWITRLLEQMEPERRRPLSGEAVSLLLQHDWPENYHELCSVLRRALGFARRGEVTEASIRLALRDRHIEEPPASQGIDLPNFLLGEQRRFLHQNLPKNNRFEALSRLVGGHLDRLKADREVDEQPLLFEELAQV